LADVAPASLHLKHIESFYLGSQEEFGCDKTDRDSDSENQDNRYTDDLIVQLHHSF